MLGQHLHQIHIDEIPGVLGVQCGPVPSYNLLQECRDVPLHLAELLENTTGDVVEPGEDVDEQGGTVHADLQTVGHEVHLRAELLILVMETLAQADRGDHVRHCVADQRSQVHSLSSCLLVSLQQLSLDHGESLADAGLQAELAQAEVSKRHVAELALFSPDWTVRCKHNACGSDALTRQILLRNVVL